MSIINSKTLIQQIVNVFEIQQTARADILVEAPPAKKLNKEMPHIKPHF
jgi:hypothetical protein